MFLLIFDDWEQRKLSDVADIIGGGTPNTNNEEYWNGDIDWYSPAEIGEQRYVNGSRKKITMLGLQKSSAKNLPVGTVLFTSRAGIGNTAILKKGGATNQGFQSILPKENQLDTYFIYSKTDELKRYGEVTGAGSTFIEVSGKQMAKMPISIPSFEEQFRIGSFFKKLDDTIALHQEKLEKLKQLKRAYLQVIFPQKGERTPRLRFANFSQDWEQGELKELASFSKGLGYTKSDLVEKGTSIILYGRLYTKYQTVIEDVDTYVTIKEKSVLSKGGEVIVPSSGESSEDIARASVVAKAGILIGGDLNIIKTENSINPIFLALNISHGKQQQELRKRAQGKSVVHLHNSDLKKVNLIYPMLEEQIQIGRFFNQLDDNIAFQSDKVEKLKKLKEVYLSKMFT